MAPAGERDPAYHPHACIFQIITNDGEGDRRLMARAFLHDKIWQLATLRKKLEGSVVNDTRDKINYPKKNTTMKIKFNNKCNKRYAR